MMTLKCHRMQTAGYTYRSAEYKTYQFNVRCLQLGLIRVLALPLESLSLHGLIRNGEK